MVDEPYLVPREPQCIPSFLGTITGAMTRNQKNSLSDAAGRPLRRDHERRAYARVRLSLQLSLRRIAGQRDTRDQKLRTRDVSSSGAFFLSPSPIDPGTPIELDLVIVHQPLGRGSVRMRADAHVVRATTTSQPGWHGVAVAFDDIRFLRDEPCATRSPAE
jgi:hypothetical protein